MGEIDYQMALILQHKYQQERFQEDRNIKSIDLEYAKSLQEQFDKENAIEQPRQDLVYKKTTTKDPTRSLTDPSWEVIDPTPDIHMLFIAFNERFFWNKLLAVCVAWSKRMTTCAGVCSYQGRSGMCNILLSEPLLKLRPRKDLVETLLHEMIHAYLFVTNNNRDRDGHGPEFHSHMYRINKEAGTNITVYHDFHDEVRLYQQHWWKCDGPCQNWKPYFGIVRRAMNRAPGPNDRWWPVHSQSCGGTFIKVKEPEKVPKKGTSKSKSSVNNNAADIRKYISDNSPKQPPKKSKSDTLSKESTSQDVQKVGNPSNTNIKGLSSTNRDGLQVGTVITSKVNNIVGFTNDRGKSDTNSSKKGTRSGGLAAANRNGSIVINKPNRISSSNRSTQVGSITNNVVGFTNNADKSPNPKVSEYNNKTVESTATSNVGTSDYSVVRNHWANKFSNSDKSAPTSRDKRKSILSTGTPSKTRKIDSEIEEMVECPVCNNKVGASALNTHLDDCLTSQMECVICGTKVGKNEYGSHVNSCAAHNLSNDDVFVEPDNVFEPDQKQCGVCNSSVPSTQYDVHLETCLHKMFDGMERAIAKDYETKNNETVSCLACNKKIKRFELDVHLEDCMNVSNIFNDDDDEPEEASSHEKRYNCPCCMELIPENDMSFHINRCLDIAADVPQAGDNRAMLAVSLSDDSFS